MTTAFDDAVPAPPTAPLAMAPFLVPPGRPGQMRSVTILAEGPFSGVRGVPLTTSVKVPLERLQTGPVGARFEMIVREPRATHPLRLSLTADQNPWGYEDLPGPVSVDALLDNPRFLAQHAYGTAASTLSAFETTLGRRMPWSFGSPRLTLNLFDTVAFADTGYVREQGMIRFGHHRDDRTRRHVSQALFHDLVAHEVTHAILDGYRPHWADGGAALDQLAMHEGVADLVALLSVFSSTERVEQQLAALPPARPPDIQPWDQRVLRTGLFRLADGLYTHGAARAFLDTTLPVAWRWEREPHHRGQALVRAVLEGLLAIWSDRLRRPGGRSSRYQVAASGAATGHQVLGMLIRGLGYTPPVDATFEDLLRGILAADLVVVPADVREYRQALRDSFEAVGLTAGPDDSLDGMAGLQALRYPVRLSAMASDPEEVNRFLWENPDLQRAARLDPDTPTVVERVRPCVRVSPDGFVVSEIGATFVQNVRLSSREARRRLGVRTPGYVTIRGGGLLRFDEGGRLCFAAIKPVMDAERQQAKLNDGLDVGQSLTNLIPRPSKATFGGMHRPAR